MAGFGNNCRWVGEHVWTLKFPARGDVLMCPHLKFPGGEPVLPRNIGVVLHTGIGSQEVLVSCDGEES